jgi:EAL domain-containing protein (putative c-di-GMP-specific phosphodiesterase class I)
MGRGLRFAGEILLRMEDESGALVAPGEFLPAAERCRLTPRVDRWVVSSALDWFSRHPAMLERLRLLTINLSGHSLGDEGFTEFVLGRIRDSALEPELICFEITETAAVRNLTEARALMTALRKVGCRFALDDFGSGLCSFAYLRSLPADYLKIAGLFVKDIERSAVDLALVRSINEIAHVMGKQTIAEFVESDTVRSCLQGIGVDYVQGYGIGWPRPIESLLGCADAGGVHEAQRVPEPSATFGSFAYQGGRS